MNKRQLTTAYAQVRDRTPKEAADDVDALLDLITDTLHAGDKVRITGFGTFRPILRAARRKGAFGRPPITSPAYWAVKFKQGAHLQRAMQTRPTSDEDA
ncbi:HU family DNA-binding protein [Streptosporangium sp. NPDC020072]|uniref:HU family DNA-binding protein n=1 Tax=Streptosporangium sp. NPDC020072 TaxID=3154788 RepID=UPI00342A50AE